jgi:hypothetical protein
LVIPKAKSKSAAPAAVEEAVVEAKPKAVRKPKVKKEE